MISCRRIIEGVPRAPKAAAWWEVLKEYVNFGKTLNRDHERIHKVICKIRVLECTRVGSFSLALNTATEFEQQHPWQSRSYSLPKRPVLKVCLRLLLELSFGLIKVLQGDLLWFLIRKHLLELASNPLFIFNRGRRVPSIQAVKFNTAGIAATTIEDLMISVANLVEWFQTPRRPLSHEA